MKKRVDGVILAGRADEGLLSESRVVMQPELTLRGTT